MLRGYDFHKPGGYLGNIGLWGYAANEARDRFEETFEILRAGLATDVLDYDGRLHRYRDVPILMKPFQEPRPPFWYPGNVEYAGAHRLNTVVAGPAAVAAQAVARYRELAAGCTSEDDFNPGVGKPTIGILRHLFVGATDHEAQTVATRAFAAYHANLTVLFKKYDVEFASPVGDPSLGGDAQLALKVEALVAGSPGTVREHIEKTMEVTGLDYFMGAFAWGDLSHAESMRSLELFAKEVMPHFASA